MDNKKINSLVVKKNNALYDKAVAKHGVCSSSVLWDDQQSQYFRFNELLKFVNLEDSQTSILDVGCGNGELYKYLNFLGFRGKYCGTDVNLTLINQAKKRFKDAEFIHADIIDKKFKTKYDYVLTSGLFNTNAGQSIDWIQTFIKKMFILSRKATLFNAISSHVNYRDEDLYYLSPSEILGWIIKNISPRVTLAHHNLPYNYTVAVFKEKNWKSINK